MLNSGDYPLCDLSVTVPLAAVALTPIIDLEGMIAVTVDFKFSYGSGGSTCKVYVQVTSDDGQTWTDIVCRAWTTVNEIKKLNLSGLTPVAAFTPTDGTMADNTLQDGILGSAMRVKITSTGTYANTTVAVNINAR